MSAFHQKYFMIDTARSKHFVTDSCNLYKNTLCNYVCNGEFVELTGDWLQICCQSHWRPSSCLAGSLLPPDRRRGMTRHCCCSADGPVSTISQQITHISCLSNLSMIRLFTGSLVSKAITCVCVWFCLSVCPHDKTKTAKITGTGIVHCDTSPFN